MPEALSQDADRRSALEMIEYDAYKYLDLIVRRFHGRMDDTVPNDPVSQMAAEKPKKEMRIDICTAAGKAANEEAAAAGKNPLEAVITRTHIAKIALERGIIAEADGIAA